MLNELQTRLQNGEIINVTFTKKDGTVAKAMVIESPKHEAKTDRVKVEAPEGSIRLFCIQRGRWITAQIDTLQF